jgi:hypothetical protein
MTKYVTFVLEEPRTRLCLLYTMIFLKAHIYYDFTRIFAVFPCGLPKRGTKQAISENA